MARKLNDEQIGVAKSWLHDLFVYGGLLATAKRPIPTNIYSCMYGDNHWNRKRFLPDAITLCDAIKLRKVDTQSFLSYDNALERLSNCYFWRDLLSTNSNVVRKPASMLAQYLAWFCKENELYWDDSNTSTYEMDEIKQTELGKALWDYGCFTSQPAPDQKKTSGAASAPNGGQPANSNGPRNDFKSRGPLSGVSNGLLGQPGVKIHLASPIYCILGVDANGTPLNDCIYIRPLDSKYFSNGVNKVLLRSANGYGYCPCYFNDSSDALAFLNLIDTAKLQNLGTGKKIDAITVFKKSAQSNGYFKFDTEYGPVYVSAAKLNESVKPMSEDIVPNNASDDAVDEKTTLVASFKEFRNDFLKD